MRAVHVGIGHDDDLVVAQLLDIKLIPANAGAQCGDQVADFLTGQHAIEPGAFDVQDLAAQGQNGLIGAAAALLGRATGRIAFDEEEFGLGGVFFLTIGKLARQAGNCLLYTSRCV